MALNLRYGEPDWNETPRQNSAWGSEILQRPKTDKSYEELRFEASQKYWASKFVDLNATSLVTMASLRNLVEVVEIIVGSGDEEARWMVHRQLLVDDSEFAALALRSNFKEKHESVIRFPEEDPDIMDHYVRYLYTGCIVTFSLEHVIQMYCLGDRLQSLKFANACYETVAQSTDSYTAAQIKYIFEETYSQDRMRSLAISQIGKGILAGKYSFSTTDEQELLKDCMPELMKGVTAAVAEMRKGGEKWYPKPTTATNTTSSTSVFSQPGVSSTSLFGPPTTQPTSTPSLFGPPNTQPSSTTSLFGPPPSNANTQPTSSHSLFGTQQPQATGGTFGFGGTSWNWSNSSTNRPQHSTANIFGTPNTSTSTLGGSLFGNNSQQPTNTGTGLFGNTQSTSRPTGGLFGAPSSSQTNNGGLFGTSQGLQGSTLFGQQPSSAFSTGFGVTSDSYITSAFGARETNNEPRVKSSASRPESVTIKPTGAGYLLTTPNIGTRYVDAAPDSIYEAIFGGQSSAHSSNVSGQTQTSSGFGTSSSGTSTVNHPDSSTSTRSLLGSAFTAGPNAANTASSAAPLPGSDFGTPSATQTPRAGQQTGDNDTSNPEAAASTASAITAEIRNADGPRQTTGLSSASTPDTSESTAQSPTSTHSASTTPARPFFGQTNGFGSFGITTGWLPASNGNPSRIVGLPINETDSGAAQPENQDDNTNKGKQPDLDEGELSEAFMNLAFSRTRSEAGGFESFLRNAQGGKVSRDDTLSPTFKEYLQNAAKEGKGKGKAKEGGHDGADEANTESVENAAHTSAQGSFTSTGNEIGERTPESSGGEDEHAASNADNTAVEGSASAAQAQDFNIDEAMEQVKKRWADVEAQFR